MIVELGHFALVLGVITAAVQVVLPLIGAHRRDLALMRVADRAAVLQCLLVVTSFAVLVYAFVVSDFSVITVVANSHTTKPLIYRISGTWGNHEGSLLLWVVMLTVFGAAVALFGRNLPASLKARVLAVQASIALAFGLFMLLTSNPFRRILPALAEGEGLNPILQDPALAFHPPLLYAGYVGFSIAFSFAVAALMEGRIDAAWARWVRPWTLAAWMCLTLGIAMGSWWAYYELGWGGWWFWDPVENASFMPWLAGTALLHSAIVMEKRDALKVWTILLAILTFSLSLMGAFLVRSGVLTSVHAFAVDPARGVMILLILSLFTGGALTLFALRVGDLRKGGFFAPISREGGLVLNNVFLTVACATVLFGTLYPLVLETFTGSTVSVGAPYFNMTFAPLMVPLLIAVPFGPALAWKRGDLAAAAQRLWFAAVVTLAVTLAVLAFYHRGPWLAPIGLALGAWVAIGALVDAAARVQVGRASLTEVLQRLANLPRSAHGTTLAHFGVGVMVIGIVATSAYQSERILVMMPKDTIDFAGYRIAFEGVGPEKGPNYTADTGLFSITRPGWTQALNVLPSQRKYDRPRQTTSEAGIHVSWRGDLYLVLGDSQPAGGRTVRMYFNPLVRLIWGGAVIMALGGLMSLSDRRLRVGAPRRSRTRMTAAPAE